jgi:1-phosphofructokinase
VQSAATGFLFEENGKIISDALSNDHVEDHGIHLPGHVRVNIKVYEQDKAVVTELNEKGNTISPHAFEQLEAKIEELSRRSSYMVFSGSVSPGMQSDTYQKLIGILWRSQCKAVLDADGDLLKMGILAKPFLIKPNLFELELLVGRKMDNLEDIRKVCGELIETGIGIVAVSLGAGGALIVDKHAAFYAPALDIPVKSTVGAGDSMVAGLLLGLENRKSLGEILRLGAASAASSISREGTGLLNAEWMKRRLDSVEVRAI